MSRVENSAQFLSSRIVRTAPAPEIGISSIRRVKAGDSQAERVFVLDGLERYPGPFGLWSGRDREGSWMFVRDRSTQEVYQLTVQLP